jgi:hypothetical protein
MLTKQYSKCFTNHRNWRVVKHKGTGSTQKKWAEKLALSDPECRRVEETVRRGIRKR